MGAKDQAAEKAQAGFWARYLPASITNWQSIATSVAFGPFEPGDFVVISCDGAAHVNAGAAGGVATASNPQLPAGVHDFVVPEGTTHVHLFGDGAGNGAAWKAS